MILNISMSYKEEFFYRFIYVYQIYKNSMLFETKLQFHIHFLFLFEIHHQFLLSFIDDELLNKIFECIYDLIDYNEIYKMKLESLLKQIMNHERVQNCEMLRILKEKYNDISMAY